MAWPRGNPLDEIDGLISRHDADRDAWRHLLEEADTTEQQLLAALDAAHDMQTRARTAIAFDTAEIADLTVERAVYLLPQQRDAG
jgi:hypothetical protein